jgi:hypothetical protein
MNILIWRNAAYSCFFGLLLIVAGCKDDEAGPPVITASDFETTIDENPESGTMLGTLSVSTDKGALSFSLKSESVSGAFSVNETTGAISVLDGTKFDYEDQTSLSAVILAVNGKVETEIDVKVNLEKIIWTGADLTFTKTSNADWTLAENQDKITDNVIFTRQNKGPIYNYQFWINNFESDATFADLNDDFWNDTESEREFVRSGGTSGIRWAILDDTGASTETWGAFELYGTLGDPTHFYSFHSIASIITNLEDENNVIGVPDDFSIEDIDGVDENSGTDMPLLVGKKLGVWIVDEDIYFTLTFTKWESGGANGIEYTRSTKD